MVMTKVEQGTAGKEDLDILKSLIEMNDEAPEIEPDDHVVDIGGDGAGAVRTPTKSAGYVNLRRQTDGKIVRINRNQLQMRLYEKLENGQRAWLRANEAWTGTKREGTMLCRLHPNHENYAEMQQLGLGICGNNVQPPKGNLLNANAVGRHMRVKHKDAFEAIREHEARRREDARDEAQATIAEGLREALAGRHLSSATKEKPLAVLACGLCGEEVTAKNTFGAHSRLKKHERDVHGAEVNKEQ